MEEAKVDGRGAHLKKGVYTVHWQAEGPAEGIYRGRSCCQEDGGLLEAQAQEEAGSGS